MTEPPAAPLDVLVVQHTHWDREWYHPAARFRQRLVALVDELLDGGEGERGPFLLDGQTVVLDDYLAVRPDRRDALAAALRDGRLEAGPWYVLADELIPGGESLIRNLLVGRGALAALGAEPPPVLYSPDAFGHAAALPALAAGFGCRLVVAWRGYGGARWPAGDAAWWRAPGGETALLFHLPRDGYEFGSNLPADPEAAAERWGRMRAELAPRARLGLALVQNGADHHARQARWPEALDALAAAAAPDRVRTSSLRDLAATALDRADALGDALPTVAGELRDSYGYTWTLQGTFATRAHQKRRNARLERALVRDVEPWLAMLCLRGDPHRDRRRALLGAAWRTLLRCHPHDTLCGCSIDAVARAMDARLDAAEAQAAGLGADARDALVGHDAAAARERRALWRSVALVRNRAPRARGGVAEVELLTFVRDVPVGPGSAGAWRPVAAPGATPVVWQDARSAMPQLHRPVQVLERALRHDRVESPRHYPDDDLVESARALVWVAPVPAYGTSALMLDPTRAPDVGALLPEAWITRPVEVGDNALDNGTLRVTVDAKGRIAVAAAALGHAVDDLLAFEDVGDAGDLYTHSPLGAPLRTTWCTGVRTVHRGPLRGEVEARFRMRVPVAAEPADDALSRPARRARRHVELPLVVRVSLDADAAFVRVCVEGENPARDHRLRVLLATGVPRATVVADAALGPVERRPIDVPPEERGAEAPPPTAPLHRWVALYGEPRSAVVVSDGLAEYEARDDGTVAVTLVRAVGELSRPDLPERPGHAGWPAATPEAQCPGPFAAELALAFYGRRTPAVESDVAQLADDVLLPLTGETNRAALAVPAPALGFDLAGRGLSLGAVKPTADGRGVALRCVNVTGEAVAGAWRIGAAVARAFASRLDETRGEPLAVEREGDAAVVRFEAPPRATVTIVVDGER